MAKALQNTALVLITKLSFRALAKPYIISTVVFFSECLKLLFSLLLTFIFDGRTVFKRVLSEIPTSATTLALPGLLYVLQNVLLLAGLKSLSPTVFLVCSQAKILTSALFAALVLKTQISRRQLFALFLLACGMVLVERAEGTQDRSAVSASLPTGVCAVLLAACISGFAGSYLEKLYKSSNADARSIWHRNAQLAVFSAPLATIVMYSLDREQINSVGLLQGYDCIVFLIVVLHASGGLCVAAAMRYASNIMKCFAVSISISICEMLTVYSRNLDVYEMSYRLVGVCSTFMYAQEKI